MANILISCAIHSLGFRENSMNDSWETVEGNSASLLVSSESILLDKCISHCNMVIVVTLKIGLQVFTILK